MKTKQFAILIATILLCAAGICSTIWVGIVRPRNTFNPHIALRHELIALHGSLFRISQDNTKAQAQWSAIRKHLASLPLYYAYVSADTRGILSKIHEYDKVTETSQGIRPPEPGASALIQEMELKLKPSQQGSGLIEEALRALDRDQFGLAQHTVK